MKTKTLTTKDIVIAAFGIALIFLATFLITIPNGIQGYLNLGDGFILLFASLLNPFLAFIAGGLGSALADVAGGYGIYFFFTLIIKGLEGCIVSILLHHFSNTAMRYITYVIGSIIMIGGYFIADAFVNQSWQLSLTGIPSNMIQAAAGILIVTLGYPLIQKLIKQK